MVTSNCCGNTIIDDEFLCSLFSVLQTANLSSYEGVKIPVIVDNKCRVVPNVCDVVRSCETTTYVTFSNNILTYVNEDGVPTHIDLSYRNEPTIVNCVGTPYPKNANGHQVMSNGSIMAHERFAPILWVNENNQTTPPGEVLADIYIARRNTLGCPLNVFCFFKLNAFTASGRVDGTGSYSGVEWRDVTLNGMLLDDGPQNGYNTSYGIVMPGVGFFAQDSGVTGGYGIGAVNPGDDIVLAGRIEVIDNRNVDLAQVEEVELGFIAIPA